MGNSSDEQGTMNSFTTDPAAPLPDRAGASEGSKLVIPVLREEAQVDTVLEHTGTVRIRKVVHQASEPVSTTGYREVVETTRVPVNLVVDEVEAPRDLGELLVIPVYEERMVRQLVLVEEIHVRRLRESFEHTVATPLLREEVIVERLDPATRQWVADPP
jgi:stress response protein YsnF